MELLLEKNEILDLGQDLRGMIILCQEGCCWLTQTGDSRDHILHAGGRFNVQRKGQLLLTASQSCRIMLLADNRSQAGFPLLRQLHCNN